MWKPTCGNQTTLKLNERATWEQGEAVMFRLPCEHIYEKCTPFCHLKLTMYEDICFYIVYTVYMLVHVNIEVLNIWNSPYSIAWFYVLANHIYI